MTNDIEMMYNLVRSGEVVSAVEKKIGALRWVVVIYGKVQCSVTFDRIKNFVKKTIFYYDRTLCVT